MKQGFSPVLAHLLMAGLARRAVLSAVSRQGIDGAAASIASARLGIGAFREEQYPGEALEWGIAAFLSGRARGPRPLPGAGIG